MAAEKTGDWVENTADELEQWAAGRGDAADRVEAGGARLLLELASQYLEVDEAGDLTAGLLEELLLEVFPESVFVTTEDVPVVLSTGRVLVEFFEATGQVPAERAAELRAVLTRIEPDFTEAVSALNETEREAAFDILAKMMADDGVDAGDEAAVERWVRDFEALPEEERFSRTAAYLLSEDEVDPEDMVVPAVRLAPVERLRSAAAESDLLRQAAVLAGWAGERTVTAEGALGDEDAVDAAEALGFDPALGLELGLDGLDPETGDTTPALPENALPLRLWRGLLHAGVLAVEDGRVRPGTEKALLDRIIAGELPQPEPADAHADTDTDTDTDADADADAESVIEPVLDLWFQLLDGVLRPAHELHGESTLEEIINHELPSILLHLYEHEGPVPRAALAEGLTHILEEEYGAHGEQRLDVVIEAILVVRFADLERWGVVEEIDSEGYLLSPLGLWAVRESLLAAGFTAPVVGELAGASAEELLAGLELYTDDTADEEIGGWLARRSAHEAASALLAVMAETSSPSDRSLSSAILHRLGSEVEPQVRKALDDPAVRPYAALWLRTKGDETVSLSPAETGWLFVDSVAGLIEMGEDDAEAVAAAIADAPAGVDLGAVCDDLWRIDHPATTEVLDALGAHHPDKKAAKSARKAAFKARSRQEKR